LVCLESKKNSSRHVLIYHLQRNGSPYEKKKARLKCPGNTRLPGYFGRENNQGSPGVIRREDRYTSRPVKKGRFSGKQRQARGGLSEDRQGETDLPDFENVRVKRRRCGLPETISQTLSSGPRREKKPWGGEERKKEIKPWGQIRTGSYALIRGEKGLLRRRTTFIKISVHRGPKGKRLREELGRKGDPYKYYLGFVELKWGEDWVSGLVRAGARCAPSGEEAKACQGRTVKSQRFRRGTQLTPKKLKANGSA